MNGCVTVCFNKRKPEARNTHMNSIQWDGCLLRSFFSFGTMTNSVSDWLL